MRCRSCGSGMTHRLDDIIECLECSHRWKPSTSTWHAFLVRDDELVDLSFEASSVDTLTAALEDFEDVDAGERFVLRERMGVTFTGRKVEWRKPWSSP